jgi:hypothetical protein
MRAALAFALRRTSARVVLAVGVGGLLFVVARAFRPDHRVLTGPCGFVAGCTRSFVVEVGPTAWDLGVAAAAVVAAMIAAAALYRRAATIA